MKKGTLNGKRIICFLVLSVFLAGMLPVSAVHAEESSVKGEFTIYEHIVARDYAYSDDFFRKPSDQYDHEFARLSLGLALAAFRDELKTEAQDDYLIEFLQGMGFSQIETDTYRAEPEKDSIGFGMAVKTIGDTDVLVCAVCSAALSRSQRLFSCWRFISAY